MDRRNPEIAGFTLIELLIVVAIIGVLAAIAVPNFLSALTKAKVAGVQSDQRALANAIELYRIDMGTVLATDGPFAPSYFERLRPLTTPISYMQDLPVDRFQPMKSTFMFPEEEAHRWENKMYIYNRGDARNGASQGVEKADFGFTWSLASVGPDSRLLYPYYFFPARFVMPEWYIYDTSNGINSGGEIFFRSVNSNAK